jgi:hypothetical protein
LAVKLPGPQVLVERRLAAGDRIGKMGPGREIISKKGAFFKILKSGLIVHV